MKEDHVRRTKDIRNIKASWTSESNTHKLKYYRQGRTQGGELGLKPP